MGTFGPECFGLTQRRIWTSPVVSTPAITLLVEATLTVRLLGRATRIRRSEGFGGSNEGTGRLGSRTASPRSAPLHTRNSPLVSTFSRGEYPPSGVRAPSDSAASIQSCLLFASRSFRPFSAVRYSPVIVITDPWSERTLKYQTRPAPDNEPNENSQPEIDVHDLLLPTDRQRVHGFRRYAAPLSPADVLW